MDSFCRCKIEIVMSRFINYGAIVFLCLEKLFLENTSYMFYNNSRREQSYIQMPGTILFFIEDSFLLLKNYL